ncbi:ribose ABC transport system permease protein RbsC [Vibrio variabilis]|uniref:Ribose ABC transport system permease protein RbsC n=1 Tax=Vibrio variabilis TaxID=990271 RepID=A0ABQ0J7R1_9VIBR|nr:ribose ABC transport system permease protein RbsC [Vibrio variabilis]
MENSQASMPIEKFNNKNILNLLSQYWIFIALIALIVAFSLLSDSFLTKVNLLNILRQVSIIGICAVGMTMIILTGGIDLSVGSMIGVAGMACALCSMRVCHQSLRLLVPSELVWHLVVSLG